MVSEVGAHPFDWFCAELNQLRALWLISRRTTANMTEVRDPHCQLLAQEMSSSMAAMTVSLQSVVLQAKEACRREAAQQLAAAEAAHAERELDLQEQIAEAERRNARMQELLSRSWQQSDRLAAAVGLMQAKGQAAIEQASTLSAWKAAEVEARRGRQKTISALSHRRRYVMRTVLCGWRTAARESRHRAIDEFWSENMRNLRGMLQEHYEPQLKAVQDALEAARSETAATLAAKRDLERQLKTAFMQAASKLNLEAVSIVHNIQVDSGVRGDS